MAEVAFRPAHQLSEYKGKGASASGEPLVEVVEKIHNPSFKQKHF